MNKEGHQCSAQVIVYKILPSVHGGHSAVSWSLKCSVRKMEWRKLGYGQEEGQSLPLVLPISRYCQEPVLTALRRARRDHRASQGLGPSVPAACAAPAPSDAGAFQPFSAFVLPWSWFAQFLRQSERESAAQAPLFGGDALKLSKNPTLSPHPC